MKLNDKKIGKIFAEPNRTEPAKISRTLNRTEPKFRSLPSVHRAVNFYYETFKHSCSKAGNGEKSQITYTLF